PLPKLPQTLGGRGDFVQVFELVAQAVPLLQVPARERVCEQLPQRRRGRGQGASPQPVQEAADRVGYVLKLDLVAGPGADAGQLAESVRVRGGRAADPCSTQLGAQPRPRPWPAECPAQIRQSAPEDVLRNGGTQVGAANPGQLVAPARQ